MLVFLVGAGATLLIINPLCKPERRLSGALPFSGRDQLNAVLVLSFLTLNITREHVGGTILSAGARRPPDLLPPVARRS